MAEFKTLDIRVVPGAKKNLMKEEGKILKLYITAPAVEGKANKAVIDFFAEYFNVKKSEIEVIKGLKSRTKTIKIWHFFESKNTKGAGDVIRRTN